MRSSGAVEIESIVPGSPACDAGLQPGDTLVSINSHPLNDVIDYMFFKSSGSLEIKFRRNGIVNKTQLAAKDGDDLGVAIKPFKVKTCKNNCLFCFVKQLPKGLRKSLYIKDEDYRLSFLYGNYMTLSNIDTRDRKRIIEQRLSPLYVSVHTTNKPLRNRMLGNPRASDILKELKLFSDRKIRLHIQIVLCPGYNDGRELQSSIRDLYKFYPYVSSIAVVPVGLTKYRRHQISPVTKENALRTLEIVEAFRKRFRKKHGDPVVYCSDEMYIKANHPFPLLKEYGALPQIENGVGMVPLFISQARKSIVPKSAPHGNKFLTFTGASFYPFLKRFIERLSEKEAININVIAIDNKFFGSSVTVAGLLTGRDVITSLHDITGKDEILLVPDTALKEADDLFLDNVSLKDIEEATGLKAVRTDATPQGLIDTIARIQTK